MLLSVSSYVKKQLVKRVDVDVIKDAYYHLFVKGEQQQQQEVKQLLII